jgi:hypothetical protein
MMRGQSKAEFIMKKLCFAFQHLFHTHFIEELRLPMSNKLKVEADFLPSLLTLPFLSSKFQSALLYLRP